MRQLAKHITIFLAAVLGVVSCIYPFNPEIPANETDMLVMEGEITAGQESYFVATKTLPLDSNMVLAEPLALTSIYVEGEKGSIYKSYRKEESEDDKFLGNKKISYAVDTRNLDKSERHRLVFQYNKKSYATDWLSFVEAPPIDSLTYRISKDSLNLEIIGHAKGVNDTSRYYKWEYIEDWEVTANYHEDYILVNGVPVKKPKDQIDNYYCWNHSKSSEINLYTTESISQNIIKEAVVKSIDKHDKRIMSLYRIDVYLKSLTKEAYKYWETLLRNNEETGDIFSPQPNEMRGNIYCVDDPNEVVLGYITSSAASTKRLYINYIDHKFYKSKDSCAPFEFEPKEGDTPSDAWGVYQVEWNDDGTMIVKTFYIEKRCLSCLYYGTKDKPEDWPNDHK